MFYVLSLWTFDVRFTHIRVYGYGTICDTMSWIYAHTCIHTCVCAPICVCVCVCVYIHIRPRAGVCTHTRLYKHIHTYICSKMS